MERDPILYLDCTSTVRTNLTTGVQRVVRGLCDQSVVFSEQLGIKCVPIANQFEAFYRVEDACLITLNTQEDFVPVDFRYRDIYFCPDAFWTMDMYQWFPFFHSKGMPIATLIYDLIPLTHPQYFSAQTIQVFENSLLDIVKYSKLLPCISFETQRALKKFCHSKNIQIKEENCPVIPIAPAVLVLPGQDHEEDNELPVNYFLIVGTLEPRRGYLEALREYSMYRDEGGEAELVIVGKRGSHSDEIIHSISTFENSVRWIDNANDSQLANLYQNAAAVVSPSLAEGYGLPVAEGLLYNGLVFANRLAVFGEFAGAHPYYFDIKIKGELSRLMASVDQLGRPDSRPNLSSWEESANAIATQLTKIAPFHGKHTAIELTKVSPESVRWAHWFVFKRQCNPEDLEIWMQYATISTMYDAMRYEVDTNNAN